MSEPEAPTEKADAVQPAGGRAGGSAPRLAQGIELLGEYKDSGFKEAHYVARRADGQILQLSRLLHVIAEECDGSRSWKEIAETASQKLDRRVSAENVRFLVQKKLIPLGVLEGPDGSAPRTAKPDQLLALKFRAALVPAGLVKSLTTIFYPFFFPPVIIAALAGLAAVDYWFFFEHGVAQTTRELLYNPLLLLMVLGLVVLATALHETGHATALRYGGGEPGVMGAGIYIVWPAFYTDVTDAYRLGRWGRIRTDLGGIYFNVLFILGIVGVYALTGFEPLLVLVLIQHMQIFQQLLPFLRLDGYYILSDLTGVPDMFMRLKPTLKSAVPGKETEKEVKVLKPWVRAVVTTWVLALIPTLLFIFGLMIFNAPRMLATAYDSFLIQYDKVSGALDDGKPLSGVVAGLQMAMLALPITGMTVTFGRVAARVARGAWSWSEGSVVRRALTGAMIVGVLGVSAYVLWPNGEYRPIQPDERGTLDAGVKQFENLDTGRPALTPEREEELGGAPTEREEPRTTDEERDPAAEEEERETTTTPTTTTSTTTTETTTTHTHPATTQETETTPPVTTETTTTTTETVP